MTDTDALRANVTTPTDLRLKPARLAGVQGAGVVRVRRDTNDLVYEILGTWRPKEGETLPASLRRAQDEGTPVTYDGPLEDPDEPERQRVTMQVRLDGIHVYRRSDRPSGRRAATGQRRTATGEGGDERATAAGRAVAASVDAAPLVIVHLAVSVAGLPYRATAVPARAADGGDATHARTSRQAVPVLPASDGHEVPPQDATLDGVLGGTWDPGDNGSFLWYSTPAESRLPFAELYDRATRWVDNDPIDLAVYEAGTTAAGRVASRTEGAKVAASAPAPRAHRVVVMQAGRSPDANYVVVEGVAR